MCQDYSLLSIECVIGLFTDQYRMHARIIHCSACKDYSLLSVQGLSTAQYRMCAGLFTADCIQGLTDIVRFTTSRGCFELGYKVL